MSSSPVRTPSGELLGVLTEMDLVKGILLSKASGGALDKVGDHSAEFEAVKYVHDSANMEEVFRAMVKSPSKRVLVQDSNQSVIGIISPKDLLAFLKGEKLESKNLSRELESYKEKLKELEQKTNSLEEAVNTYRTLVVESPSMTHSVGANGRIQLANKKLHSVLGYREDELIGKDFLTLYDPVHHNNAKNGLTRVKEDGYHQPIYTTMVKKNGESIKVEVVSSSLKDKKGNFLGTITVARPESSNELSKLFETTKKP